MESKEIMQNLEHLHDTITNDLIAKDYSKVALLCKLAMYFGTLPEIKTVLICTKDHKEQEVIKPQRERLLAKYEELRGSKSI